MPEALAMNRFASPPPTPPRRRPRPVVAIALLALGSQAGCGREFYREWANQDVSEAVFEKSRDPRFRLDLYSIDPPALSRFADPYDRDRPPAPPDDLAAQALSPVPQWPDHRLIMPVEGTGYLTMLDQGPRYEPPKPAPSRTVPIVVPNPTRPPEPNRDLERNPSLPRANPLPDPIPPPHPTPSPSNPGGTAPPGPGAFRSNSGPSFPDLSPIPVAAHDPQAPSPKRAVAPKRPAPSVGKDEGIRRAATQEPTRPMPTESPNNSPVPIPPPSSSTTQGGRIQTPRISGDPNPVDPNLSNSEDSRRNRARAFNDDFQAEEQASNLARMFVPEDVNFDEAVAAALPSGSRPYVLSMEKAFQLALINSRYYQYQLENVYINALPVTLQRFAFSPQFIAGASPLTGAGGIGSNIGGLAPLQNPPNSFLYQTRATGNQISTLNLGTVAGVGKLFDNGTRILASFANSVVFNFVGKNPAQPTVRSFLPLQVVVPFLRGGGRAVTLELLTQTERNLVYSVRAFAKFRQEFVVATLGGGTIQTFGSSVVGLGFSSQGNIDPTPGFLNVVEDVQLVENSVRNLAVFERLAEVYAELIGGEASGLSQLQLDQLNQQVQGARQTVISQRLTYRNDLDAFKLQVGMPPDVPVVIDRSRTRQFKKVYEEIDKWSLTPRRELEQLEDILARLPDLEDLVLDGRSAIAVFTEKDDPNLEGLLLTAERVALENRLDLMNARAQLYDAWRQIRVTANALKGVFTVNITNQFLTPPTTNNPFGFVDQAKQFSLALNSELPLVRVAERNAFSTALINYQRQRRVLQNTEDAIKLNIRVYFRYLQFYYQQYKLAERNLLYAIRLKDQAFEQIIAPPQGNAGGNANPALQTTNLIGFQNSVLQNQNVLVATWYNYQLYRLQIYRDLGILPYDEWEAFDEIFPPDRSGAGLTAAVERDGRPAVARAAVPVAAPGPAGRR